TSGDKLADLAHITVDELKRAAEDMSEVEVARARAQMKAGMLMGLESPSARAERLARMISIWDCIPVLDEVVAQIDAVSVEAVRGYAGAMSDGAPAAMALYGPVSDAPDIVALQARLVA
ncbi:insulinase family protein, partial [Planktomarina temperata]|nr:insulinase family protein [Planktomarina temperata]